MINDTKLYRSKIYQQINFKTIAAACACLNSTLPSEGYSISCTNALSNKTSTESINGTNCIQKIIY